MKVYRVLLLGVVTLMSSNEAASTASHAQVLRVDTTGIVQPNTHAQQNAGGQRFLRGDTSEDEIEERSGFEGISKSVSSSEKLPEEISRITLPNQQVVKSKSDLLAEKFAKKIHNAAEATKLSEQTKMALHIKKKIEKPKTNKLTSLAKANAMDETS